jgi:hypothetical protein
MSPERTSSTLFGAVVPIPTDPVLVIIIAVAPLVVRESELVVEE